MENASEFRIVFVTAKTYDNAQQISRILVTESLAACCSIIHNVTSIFGWQGTTQERKEYMIIIKAAEEKLKDLEARIKELHTDEVPEIIAVNLSSASSPYLNWLKQSMMI
jgi:periplasmic divalent cation tolerance protein